MTEQPQTVNPDVTPPEIQSHFKIFDESTFKSIQSILSIVLGFATILTASGFVIVNIHLSRFTTMLVYDVTPTQYIVAGLGFWFVGLFFGYLMWRISSNPTTELSHSGQFSRNNLEALLKQGNSLTTVLFKQKERRKGSQLFFATLFMRIVLFFAGFINLTQSRRGRITLVVIYFILGGIGWGLAYMHVPRYLGGGYPAVINIVLKEDINANSLGLTLDSNFKNRTLPVVLLANLTNGVLIVDVVTGNVIDLHNDAILAIVDSKPFQPALDLGISVTLTAMPTPSLQITPISTDIPTPTIPLQTNLNP